MLSTDKVRKHLELALAELKNLEVHEKIKESHQSSSHKDTYIVLEVGHGGHPDGFEPGAVDPRTGIREWDMNKVCAMTCKATLAAHGYTNVVVTDQNDYLYNIGEKHKDCEVFISVHHNAFSNPNAQGSEALVHKTKATAKHKELAAILAEEMSKALDIANRGVKTMSLSVLSGAIYEHHEDSQGVVLVEPYFITGSEVENHKEWSTVSGKAIARGVMKFLEKQDTTSAR